MTTPREPEEEQRWRALYFDMVHSGNKRAAVAVARAYYAKFGKEQR